ncbi:unnamed protein product [Natator depressus]
MTVLLTGNKEHTQTASQVNGNNEGRRESVNLLCDPLHPWVVPCPPASQETLCPHLTHFCVPLIQGSKGTQNGQHCQPQVVKNRESGSPTIMRLALKSRDSVTTTEVGSVYLLSAL